MNADILSQFLSMLVDVRTCSVLLSPAARDTYYLDAGGVLGFLSALRVARIINHDEETRMYWLFVNACEHSVKPFPSRLNAGPCIWPWDLRQRREQAREETADAPIEVPAPAAPRVVYLLCMRGPRLAGGTSRRLQPVHTLHRMPPYASVHGRWDHASGIRCLEGGLQYLSCGAGVYLREAPARTPTAEVLARCVRQRQTDAVRPRLPSIAAYAAV